MTEKEFDQKIRNRALKREGESSQPLWGKEEVWSRIDSALQPVYKRNKWWQVATLFLLFLLSAGWSVAQYLSIEKYKRQKELEISQLKDDVKSVKTNNDLLNSQLQEEIGKKDDQIEVLKREISTQNRQSESLEEVRNSGQQEVRRLEAELNEREKMINDLQNEIIALQQDANTEPEAILIEPEDTMMMQLADPEIDETSTRIYYINGSSPNVSDQNGNRLRINLFGRDGNNVEYKSNQSIFSK